MFLGVCEECVRVCVCEVVCEYEEYLFVESVRSMQVMY